MTATLAFDSLKYARRLQAAGVPESQAEVQAELMAEAFGFYAENLVTRDYLDATLSAAFAAQDAKFEQRFAAIDQRFVELEAKFNRQFVDSELRFDRKLADLELLMPRQFGELRGQMRLLMAMISVTWLLVGLPLLKVLPVFR